MDYIIMMSVAQIIKHQMVWLLANTELERIWEQLWPNLRYYHCIWMDGLRKTTEKLSQDSQFLNTHLNPGPSKSETGQWFFATTNITFSHSCKQTNCNIVCDWSCSVHRHVSQELKSISELLENEDGAIVLRSGLGIKGSAITPEKKPRVPTMSERDLTRIHTARH